MNVTCNTCGYAGSIKLVELHACHIQQSGGRCEDYPCCGHTDGDGCQTLREHTSEFWSEMYSKFPDMMDDPGHWDY